MKKRQRLLAVLLSLGMAFGMCESGSLLVEVEAQEAVETEDAKQAETETEVEMEEEETEVSVKSVEEPQNWKVEDIYQYDSGDAMPGATVRVGAEVLYEDEDGDWVGIGECKDLTFNWEVVGGYQGVSIQKIPNRPEAYVTIPKDFFEQVKGENDDEYNSELGIRLTVLKDGTELAEGEGSVYVFNPEYMEYKPSVTFESGYTKKNIPLNQWIKVTAECMDKEGNPVKVDSYRIGWYEYEMDISEDGITALPEASDDDGLYNEKSMGKNTFYIRREERYPVSLYIDYIEKDDKLTDLHLEFEALNIAENEYIDHPAEEKKEAEENILILNQPESVNGTTKWFSFTPEATGDYKFIFECEDGKWTNNSDALYLYVEKKDGLHRIEYSTGSNIRCTLEQGTTYYLCASYDDGYDDESDYTLDYTVTVVKAIDELAVFCDGKILEGDGDYYFTCDRNGSVTLKVADSEGNLLDGATYKWYEWVQENQGYTSTEVSTEAQYTFEFSSYREVSCEVNQNGDTETVYMYPSCKTHSFVKQIDPSTCQYEGEEWEECTFCYETRNWKTLPLGDHSGQWTDVSAATVFAPAAQTRKCTKCGQVENRTIGSILPATITPNASMVPLKIKQTTKKFYVALAAGDSVVAWTSSNKKVATVSGSANGTCTIKAGKKTGSANITITTAAGAVKSVKVKVQKGKVKTSSVKQVPKKITIKKGQTYKLSPMIQPITSPDKAKYSSKNKKIASVSGKGVVKGKKAGKTKITVKAGKKKVTCTVVVTK